MNCPICSKPIETPTTGRPKAFCSPACRLKSHRSKSDKPTTSPSETPHPVTAKLSSLLLKKLSKTPANPQKHDPYSPTQNDANIAALIKHGSNATLPYPDHSAIPLLSLPPTKPSQSVQPVTFSDQPTF